MQRGSSEPADDFAPRSRIVSRKEKPVHKLWRHLRQWNPSIITELEDEDGSCTKSIAIGNAGLSCGFSEDDIKLALAQAPFYTEGEPVRVLMVPDKPFAIVSFENSACASQYWGWIAGQKFASRSGQVLPWSCMMIELPQENNNLSETMRAALPGLFYLPDFISEMEADLLEKLVNQELQSPGVESLKNRKVFHYGHKFRYGTNDVDPDAFLYNIPDTLDFVLARLLEKNIFSRKPDQIIVNVYEAGQGIPAHVDTHSAFEDTIASLSVGGPVVMDFTRQKTSVPVVLHSKSLLVMKDEARYDWKHGISTRGSDHLPGGNQAWRRERRISFTFRCVRPKLPCACAFPTLCDSRASGSSPARDDGGSAVPKGDRISALESDPVQLESEFVHNVYDQIAPHFSETRHKPWPKVVSFLQSFSERSFILDVGCGNGKYLGLRKDLIEVGCDRSVGLLEICRARSIECFLADILSLPYRSSICDGLICIAVVHHLSTQERRLHALKELMRVLVVGGRALVYVWALEQKKDQKNSTYLKETKKATSEEERTRGLLVHTNRSEFREQNLLVPWHLKGRKKEEKEEQVFHRYYHVFREGELQELCGMIENAVIDDLYYDEGNWCVVLRKVAEL